MRRRYSFKKRRGQPWTMEHLIAHREVAATGCWVWVGDTSPSYGLHRIAFELVGGAIPPGMDLMHSCDNPPCFNPEHLTPGTRLDNVHDMHAKGRGRKAVGPANGKSKLTEEQVRAIKADPRAHRTIAEDYGVGHTAVGSIKRGRTWKHL